MTAGAWIFMLVSWAILIAVNGFCFSIMLRKKKAE